MLLPSKLPVLPRNRAAPADTDVDATANAADVSFLPEYLCAGKRKKTSFICCDLCEAWYHCRCVDFPVDEDPAAWYCPLV